MKRVVPYAASVISEEAHHCPFLSRLPQETLKQVCNRKEDNTIFLDTDRSVYNELKTREWNRNTVLQIRLGHRLLPWLLP